MPSSEDTPRCRRIIIGRKYCDLNYRGSLAVSVTLGSLRTTHLIFFETDEDDDFTVRVQWHSADDKLPAPEVISILIREARELAIPFIESAIESATAQATENQRQAQGAPALLGDLPREFKFVGDEAPRHLAPATVRGTPVEGKAWTEIKYEI